MKAYAFLILLLFTLTGYSQNTINNYKYVLVPEKFDFLKENNQYGLNTLAKLLLQDKGFSSFVGIEEAPPEFGANKCDALIAEVKEKKGLFITNLTLLLKDCQGTIIFKSKEGKSREKEYQTAYTLALRDAFSSLNDVPYKYDSAGLARSQQSAAPPAVPSSAPAPGPEPVPVAITETPGALYTQETASGYQLIDTTPKKVLTLLKTSMQDYFIAEDGAANGVVFKRNGEWFFERYINSKLVSQKLQIKF